jgi:hypothetical protein
MINNKAPGRENIPTELNKKEGQLLINMLHSLIRRIWTEKGACGVENKCHSPNILIQGRQFKLSQLQRNIIIKDRI